MRTRPFWLITSVQFIRDPFAPRRTALLNFRFHSNETGSTGTTGCKAFTARLLQPCYSNTGPGVTTRNTVTWLEQCVECMWQVLSAVSRCGGATSVCVDRAAGAALVHFEQAAAAGAAVRELRRVAATVSAAEPDHPRLCVDYASRECQVKQHTHLRPSPSTVIAIYIVIDASLHRLWTL